MSKLSVSYLYEMKKLLFVRKGWLFLIGILMLQIGFACFANPVRSDVFDRELYAEYIVKFGGVYSAETAQAIVDEIEGEMQLAAEQDTELLHTAQDWEMYNNRMMLANMKLAALNALQTKYNTLSIRADMQPELTYDLEICAYLKKYGMNWASLIGILFLTPMLMLGDASCGMEQILFPTVIGKRVIMRAKLLAAYTISAGLTAICTLLQWSIMSMRWNLGELNIPIQSITGFEDCMVQASVITCILIFAAIRILAASMLSLLICLLSILIRKETAVVSITAILIAISAFLSDQNRYLSICSMFNGMHGINAMKGYVTVDILCLVVVLLLKTAFLWRIIHITAKLDNWR